MDQNEIATVSQMLNVRSIEIQNMESRLSSGDIFLNQNIGEKDGYDLMSLLQDESVNLEELTEQYSDSKLKTNWLMKVVETLTDRERIIIKARKLKDKSTTLDELGKKLEISKERVRQIETRALRKLQKTVLQISQQEKEFFIWSFYKIS